MINTRSVGQYDKCKKYRRPVVKHTFVEARHLAIQKLKQVQNRYIKEILGLNSQSQSVFTFKSPLKLSQLSSMDVKDLMSCGKINPHRYQVSA